MTNRLLWTVAATATLVGCSSPPEGLWMANLPGTDARVAVEVKGDDGAAYVCGGPTTLESHTRWFSALVDESTVNFERDGWTLSVNLDEEEATVELIAPDGASVLTPAPKFDQGEIIGFFTGIDSGCRAGVIVLSGDEAGMDAQGAWCDELGNMAQVNPVLPVAQNPAGMAVTAQTPSGERSFFVQDLNAGEIVAELGAKAQ